MARSVYDIITDRIIEKLETGTVPWQKPWNAEAGQPRNIRGTVYRGVNVFLLGCQGYESPYWLTFRQARELGGSVRRGERGSPVVFWKWNERAHESADGEARTLRSPILRYYTVFNAAQCEGIPVPKLEQPHRVHEPIGECEAIVAGYPSAPTIRHGGGAAFYVPAFDAVTLPVPEAFESGEAYYATLFHELGHSTGHRSRLARDGVVNVARFASHAYSCEELVAEMTAAFLSARCGIERTLDNSAAYIAGWLRVLRRDARMVVVAGAQAQKAAEWILDERKAEERVAALALAA